MSAILFRDQSIMVFYIQVYLKEKYPNAVVFDEDTQETVILNNKKLRVTGTYDYTTYQVLSCYMRSYFPNEGFPKEIVWDKTDPEQWEYVGMQDFTVPDGTSPMEHLVDVITENIDYGKAGHPEVLQIPERVQSYLLNEVVTQYSPEDEVFRVQKMMRGFSKIPDAVAGEYYGTFEESIRLIQQNFLDKETFPVYPERFNDFKVTGYCDPWTEVLIENGY